ncbi:MAG: glycoside hydrolase family 2 TIM barrel-domain containing protein [Oscillospiraceae bacterium]|nr:glycoside hydrolase family 2 TIM barrel-domain containing protein [Oscillospiraceae bacterium]
MIRTFAKHQIRRQVELSDCLWRFHSGDRRARTAWQPVQVPGCWEQLPGLENYRGVGTYERTFEVQGSAPATLRLTCYGVSHTATVLVDGQLAEQHYNAYTAFSVLLPQLAPGQHTLTIEADNRFSPDSALHVPNDYMTYGGIIRAVSLEQLPQVYLRHLKTTPLWNPKGSWQLRVELALANISTTAQHCVPEVQLPELATGYAWPEQRLAAGEERQVRTVLDLPTAQAWSPEMPQLYRVVAQLSQNGQVTDDLIERTGLREIRLDGSDLRLNGRKLRIKGFCRHEDHPSFGCALPFAAIQQDLVLLKDLGANSVRTSHYPNSELFLDLCDEQGILVWEENHARGLTEEQMRNPNFEPQAEACIREMIRVDYNHPCIYIWGILNECASDTSYGRSCYARQYELIGQLDRSRPRSSASCKFLTDRCLDLPEVVSFNIYPEWYNDQAAPAFLTELYTWVQEETAGRGKPFLITETGAGAIYGYRTPSQAKWSEEYQAQALRDQLAAVFNQPGCSGVYVWQFCDVRVSREWFSSRPRSMNNKGVVDEYRRPKLSYAVVQDCFRALDNYRE